MPMTGIRALPIAQGDVTGLVAALAAKWDPANALVVAPSGGDHTTIQAAIDAAADHDLILVAPASYTEDLTISKRLAIVGWGAYQAPWVSTGRPLLTGSITVSSLNVLIAGFQLSGCRAAVTNAGMTLWRCSNVLETDVSGAACVEVGAGGTAYLLDCYLELSPLGPGVQPVIVDGSGAYLYARGCYLRGVVSDGANSLTYNAGSVVELSGCHLEGPVDLNVNGAVIHHCRVIGAIDIASGKTAAVYLCGLSTAITGAGSNLIGTPYNVVDADV